MSDRPNSERDGGECLIESAANPRYKSWRKLTQAKHRRREGRFIVESRKLVAELIAASIPIECLICRAGEADSVEMALEALLERFELPDAAAKLHALPRVYLSAGLFNELSALEQPDGVMAVAAGPLFTWLDSEDDLPKLPAILLDGIQDPGNLGTILRSCEAFGIESVIAVDAVDYENLKALRASMGSVFRLGLYKTSAETAVQWHRRGGIRFIGTAMHGASYRRFEWTARDVLIIGSEGGGVRETFLSLSDERVSIPMQGSVESLNAGVAASLLIAEMAFFRARE